MSDQEHLWLSDDDLLERTLRELDTYRRWALASFETDVTQPHWPALTEARRRAQQRSRLPHLVPMSARPVVERN